MGFLKNIFGKKEELKQTDLDFWTWFKNNERDFFKIVKTGTNLEEKFFNLISTKLDEYKEGIFYLTGMFDDETVELIFTADGNIKNIAFIEDLVKDAPEIKGWKFTALKPAIDIQNLRIEMDDLKFDGDNLFFISNDAEQYPDLIDITIIHNAMTDENKNAVINGAYIFLDNYLGELELVNTIDNIDFKSKTETQGDLIPISKLKDYLIWRQKEFVEKYDSVRHNTENDEYSILEAQLDNGNPLIAVVNRDLLDWEHKTSHQWVSVLTFKYDGTQHNGMPNEKDYQLLNTIDDELNELLLDSNGHLNIGRQTANGEREVYFASIDFRLPSKVFHDISVNYNEIFEIDFSIYKDKYWQTFNKFQ